MAFVDDKQRKELLEKATAALRLSDQTEAHSTYREIVELLTRFCNKNQKEIASELQQLAKAVESDVGAEQAFDFKQRTCAVMLELSMEERRRARMGGEPNRPSAPAISSPVPAPAMTTGPGTETATAKPSEKNGNKDAQQIPGSEAMSDHQLDQTRANSVAESGDTAGMSGLSLPFLSLDYIYMSSADYEKDVAYYIDVLGGKEAWRFDRFGSRVTAINLSSGPLVLIADHRKAPGCQPVFRVLDLSKTARELKEKGWIPQVGPFGTPNGEAYSFKDPSGNSIAIYQLDETSTDRAYYDPTDSD